MIQRFALYAGRHVRNARYAEHIDTHVPGDDGLLNRGHANQVRTQSAKGPDFCRCLEAWPQQSKIDALIERVSFFLCCRLRNYPKMPRVSLCHIEEAQA